MGWGGGVGAAAAGAPATNRLVPPCPCGLPSAACCCSSSSCCFLLLPPAAAADVVMAVTSKWSFMPVPLQPSLFCSCCLWCTLFFWDCPAQPRMRRRHLPPLLPLHATSHRSHLRCARCIAPFTLPFLRPLLHRPLLVVPAGWSCLPRPPQQLLPQQLLLPVPLPLLPAQHSSAIFPTIFPAAPRGPRCGPEPRWVKPEQRLL